MRWDGFSIQRLTKKGKGYQRKTRPGRGGKKKDGPVDGLGLPRYQKKKITNKGITYHRCEKKREATRHTLQPSHTRKSSSNHPRLSLVSYRSKAIKSQPALTIVDSTNCRPEFTPPQRFNRENGLFSGIRLGPLCVKQRSERVGGIFKHVILFALITTDNLVNLGTDGNEGIDESVELVFWFRLGRFNQPAPVELTYAQSIS